MSKPKAMTEAEAVRALERLAARWPQTIGLLSWSGSLCVVSWPPRPVGSTLYVTTVASVGGIPNEGGDPDPDPTREHRPARTTVT